MFCQAYDLYAKGITSANKVLSDLSASEDFIKFVRVSVHSFGIIRNEKMEINGVPLNTLSLFMGLIIENMCRKCAFTVHE